MHWSAYIAMVMHLFLHSWKKKTIIHFVLDKEGICDLSVAWGPGMKSAILLNNSFFLVSGAVQALLASSASFVPFVALLIPEIFLLSYNCPWLNCVVYVFYFLFICSWYLIFVILFIFHTSNLNELFELHVSKPQWGDLVIDISRVQETIWNGNMKLSSSLFSYVKHIY